MENETDPLKKVKQQPKPKRAKDLISDFKENSDQSDNEIEVISVTNDSDSEEPLVKIKKQDKSADTSKKKRYVQKYVKDWEKIPAFKQWLSESVLGNTYFYCKFCKSDNKCGKTELEKHMSSRKHMKNAKEPTVKVQRKFTFRGLLCPVFTPLCKQGVNYSIIPQYAKYLHLCGVKGILVCDVIGEGGSLNTNERMKLTEEWAKQCEEYKMTLMVQVGGTCLKDVQELARHAEMKKVGAVVVLPDLYNRPENHYDLMRYIKCVSCSATTIPLLYHHYPEYTKVDIDMVQFLNDMLGEIDSFVGIIYSSNNLKEAASALAVNEDKYTVLVGTDEFIFGSTALGFNSITTVCMNFVPKVVQSIRTSVNNGSINAARLTQKYLTNIMDLIFTQGQRVPALKCAMNILTPVNVGPVRDPLVNIWEDKVKKLKSDLNAMMAGNKQDVKHEIENE